MCPAQCRSCLSFVLKFFRNQNNRQSFAEMFSLGKFRRHTNNLALTVLAGFIVLLIVYETDTNYQLSLLQPVVVDIGVNNTFEAVGVSESLEKFLVERINADRRVLMDHGMDLPAVGGVAKRIMLVSTCRSGSTFIGELLSTVPGAIYHFEPFLYMIYKDIPVNNASLAAKYIDKLTQLHQCNYAPILKSFGDYQRLRNMALNFNIAFNLCREIQTNDYCQRQDYLSYACKYFPVQVEKLVRMPLRYIVPLLRQPEQKLHVILLVRDPRATLASRRKLLWCVKNCSNKQNLCQILRDNYETALQAAQEFPENLTVLRYEDLALDPKTVSVQLFKRIGIPLTSRVQKYIKEHTSRDGSRVRETVRQKGSRVTLWKNTLPWEHVEDIQKLCGDTLNKYGYVPVPSSESLNETETIISNWKLPSAT